MATFLTDFDHARPVSKENKRHRANKFKANVGFVGKLKLLSSHASSTLVVKSDIEKLRAKRLSDEVGFIHTDNMRYYDDLPCRPGADFFGSLGRFRSEMTQAKAIVETCFKGIGIVDTFCQLHNDSIGIYTNRANGQITFKNEFSIDSFYQIIDDPKVDEATPLLVQKRRKQALQNCNTCTPLTRRAFGSATGSGTSVSEGSCTVYQKYIGSLKRAPRVFRLCYTPGNLPRGFLISVTGFPLPNDVNPDRALRMSIASFETSPPELLQVTRCSSSAVTQGVPAAQAVMRLLRDFFGLHVTQVVIDLQADSIGRLLFSQVKAFTVAKNSKRILPALTNEVPVEAVEEVRRVALKESALRRSYCAMCGFVTPREKLAKRVTFKMIIDVIDSHRKRGVAELPFANKKLGLIKPSPDAAAVCELCYSLCRSEFELIKVQTLLDRILSPSVLSPTPSDIVLPSRLRRWRLFIFLKKLEFDSTNVPIPARLKCRVFNSIEVVNVLLASASSPVAIRIPRILRVLTDDSSNISRAGLPDSLEIELTSKRGRYTGVVSLARLFTTTESSEGVRFTSSVVLSNDARLIQMHVTCGLVRDNAIGAESVTRASLIPDSDAFLSPGFCGADALPSSWIDCCRN